MSTLFLFTDCILSGACPDQWTHLPGGCYRFLTEKLTWESAKQACEQLPGGGSLVKIDTKEQNDAIYEEVKNIMSTAWIGLTDKAKEGEWVWTSGQHASFTNWANGPEIAMPDNYKGINRNGENCVVLNSDPKSKANWAVPKRWNDESCLYKTGAICQREDKTNFLKAKMICH